MEYRQCDGTSIITDNVMLFLLFNVYRNNLCLFGVCSTIYNIT